MTEAEAIAAMKAECAVLDGALADATLTYFLNKNSKAVDGVTVYNLNRAIYEALGSALTVLPVTFSRGGVSHTREDLTRTLKEFQRKAAVGDSNFPGVGIGVIVRDLQG